MGIGAPLTGTVINYTISSYWLPLAAAVVFSVPILRPVRRLLSPPYANGKREAKPLMASSALFLRIVSLGITGILLFYSVVMML